MTCEVIISETGRAATVKCFGGRAVRIDGIDDARRWVEIYEKCEAIERAYAGNFGRDGRFYRNALTAFRQALDGMRARQEELAHVG